MALVVGDRIQETTTTTGTGTISLLGAVTQFQSFAAGVGNGNSTYYTIADQSGVNWEEGIGTYTTSGSTLTRTVLASSNAGALVNFPAGTKNVFCSYPAEAAVLAAPYTYPTVQPTLNLDFVNSGQIDPRITFTRATTATYYDGKTTALAEQNLLLQSQAFGTTPWVVTGSSITTTETAPDGTTTASLWAPLNQYNSIRTPIANISGLIVGATYTVSLWVKNNIGTNVYTIWLDGSSTLIGTITPTSTWTRYSFSFVYPASATVFNILQDRNTSGFGSVYVWGAQLEQRSSATAYTPTTTAAITNYIPQLMTAPAGVPRLDYNPTTGQPLGLLIEESRTNLLTYSSDFSNGFWVKSSTSIVTDTIIAPDGTLTGDKLVTNVTTTQHSVYSNLVVSTLGALTVYAKAGEKQYVQILSTNADSYANFDLISGTVSLQSLGVGSIVSIGNGWYRCIFVPSLATTRIFIVIVDSGSAVYNAVSTGNGYSGIYIWGAQLEAGSFATSYIPTTTTSVTRNADQASMTGTNFSSWYNQSQGSFYAEYDVKGLSNYAGVFWITDITTFDRGISLVNNSAATAVYYGTGSATLYTASLLTPVVNIIRKAVVTYTNMSIGLCVNSVNASQTITPNSPFYGTIYIGRQGIAGEDKPLTGHIRKLSYYPVALPSATLQALTS